MAHYAFLDENNIVTEVIVGLDENELIEGLDPETWYGNFRGQTCKRTSYNTYGGTHLLGGVPFRVNAAGRGSVYDEERDAFIQRKPHSEWNSWILNASLSNNSSIRTLSHISPFSITMTTIHLNVQMSIIICLCMGMQ